MSFDLTIKPKEAEIAECISFADPVTARVLRRLAFQRDRLNAENERLRTLVEAVVYWLETTNIYQIDAEEMGNQIRKCREALEGTK